MEDLDATLNGEDRRIKVGGEIFLYRVRHWSETADLLDGMEDMKTEENGDFSWRADAEFAIANMPKYLDPVDDSHKRWKALCARKNDPVPRHLIVRAFIIARERSTGVPTQPPSAQPAGGGTADTSSSDESSSQEATLTA